METMMLRILLIGMALACVAGVPSPQRILFIGNSLTYWHNGLYHHLEKMAAAASPAIAIETNKVVQGGASLKKLWEKPESRPAIASGNHDVVVLQEDIPETNVASFRDYARTFVAEIRAHEGRPILLMAWSYERLGWISSDEIAQAHRDAAEELNVEVAPAGLAWQRSIRERPEIDLYAPDREHPSIHGTYLTTAVVFATIFAQSPVGIAYAPPGITADEAAYLQRVAWETCQSWKQ
jgi:hypothetical protein